MFQRHEAIPVDGDGEPGSGGERQPHGDLHPGRGGGGGEDQEGSSDLSL